MSNGDIQTFDALTTEDIISMVRYYRANGPWDKPARRVEENEYPFDEIYCRNDSGEIIPPYGCMQVTGTEESEGQNYLLVKKPADSQEGFYLFNNHYEVEIQGQTTAQLPDVYRVIKDSSDTTTVTPGQKWKPVDGQWYLEAGGEEFIAAGDDDISDNVFKVRAVGAVGAVQVKTPAGGIPAATGTGETGDAYVDGSATCDLIDPTTGLRFSPNRTETVYNQVNVALGGNLRYGLVRRSGKWYVDVGDCQATLDPPVVEV